MKVLGATIIALAMSTGAIADEGQDQGQGQGQGQGQNFLDLSSLKDKCIELTANQQLKPFKIQVTCSQVSTVWKEGAPTQITLPNTKEVGASMRMKSFEVPYVGEMVGVAESPASCSVLEKYRESIPAVDVEITCQELDQINSLSEFCAPHLNARLQEDPGILISEKTGDVFNTCLGGVGQQQDVTQ